MRTAACLLLLTCLWLPGLAHARVEERRSLPDPHELPASTMRWPQQSPVLSGLEWSSIAPPGMLLMPVEDEPYIYNQGSWYKGLPYPGHGLSSIQLISHDPPLGAFQAVASLRMSLVKGDANPLRLSFDDSFQHMARAAQIASELRTDNGYSVTELRSPLGLTDPRDKENCGREYLGYVAELPSPLMHPRREDHAMYSSLRGELRVLRIVDGAHYLLTVEFAARDYPYAIALTHNIACLVLEQFAYCEPEMCVPAYAPYETEWYWPVADSALLGQLNEGVADLVEQPDSGLHPSHMPERLEQPGAAQSLQLPEMPSAPRQSLPEGEVRMRIMPDGRMIEAPDEDWADLPYEPRGGRAAPRNPLDGWLDEPASPPQAPINPLEGWLDDMPETASPVNPLEGWQDSGGETPTEETGTAASAEGRAVPDASAAAPGTPAPLQPQLPRLFEGWGSPRSNAALPATPSMLEPFAGWLGDTPGSIAAEVARQLRRREKRGY